MDSDLTLVLTGGAIAAVVGVLVMNLFKEPEETEEEIAIPTQQPKKKKTKKQKAKKQKKVKEEPEESEEEVVEEEEEETSEEEEVVVQKSKKNKKKKKGKKKAEEKEEKVKEVPVEEPTKKKKKGKKNKKEETPPAPETSKSKKKKNKKEKSGPTVTEEFVKVQEVEDFDDFGWEVVPISAPKKASVKKVADSAAKKLPSRELDLGEHVPAVIGKSGSKINKIKKISGAKIDISKQGGKCIITGTVDQVQAAYDEIVNVLAYENSILNTDISVPSGKMGNVIGEKGATIQAIQNATECMRMKANWEDNKIHVRGTLDQIEKAKQMIAQAAEGPKYDFSMTYDFTKKLGDKDRGDTDLRILLSNRAAIMRKIESETGGKLDLDRDNRKMTVMGKTQDIMLDALNKLLQEIAANTHSDSVKVSKKELGPVMGKKGVVLNHIRNESKCMSIDIQDDADGDSKNIILSGTKEAVAAAKALIEKYKAGGPVKPIAGPNEQVLEISIASEHVGSVIGQKGAVIKTIQEESGAQVDIHRTNGGGVCWVLGSAKAVKVAEAKIKEKVAQSEQLQKDRSSREKQAIANDEEIARQFDTSVNKEGNNGDEEEWGGGSEW